MCATFLAGLALAVVPTFGADQSVSATGGNTFNPPTVTVAVGERVTWTRTGGSHNVKFDDGSFEEPSSASSSWDTVSRTFTTPGTYRYYCELHGGQGGSGMSGTVVVTSPSTTGTPPPGGGPPGSGPPGGTVNDKVAPDVKLAVSSGQRILKRRGLVVDVHVDEQATVSASAKIATPGASRVVTLKKVTRKLEANSRAKLKLKLSRKARAGVASALRRGARLKAKVKVVAKDAAGNSRTSTKTVKVKK
jgi:plastocyanin